jgi:hypothetical protein
MMTANEPEAATGEGGCHASSDWCAGRRTACTRRAGFANSLTSRLWVSTSMMANHCVIGYFLPCHSHRRAIHAEVSVPTIDVGHHCLAATE